MKHNKTIERSADAPCSPDSRSKASPEADVTPRSPDRRCLTCEGHKVMVHLTTLEEKMCWTCGGTGERREATTGASPGNA